MLINFGKRSLLVVANGLIDEVGLVERLAFEEHLRDHAVVLAEDLEMDMGRAHARTFYARVSARLYGLEVEAALGIGNLLAEALEIWIERGLVWVRWVVVAAGSIRLP